MMASLFFCAPLAYAQEQPLPISPANNSVIDTVTPSLFWHKVEGANNYVVRIFRAGAGRNLILELKVKGGSCRVGEGYLSPGEKYYWTVIPRTGGRPGKPSKMRSFKISQADDPGREAAAEEQPEEAQAPIPLSRLRRAADEDGNNRSDKDPAQGTFGVGLNYPGLGARYFFTDKFAMEAKLQFGDNIVVGGGRFYFYPSVPVSSGKTLNFFWGGELDYLSFKGEVSKGSGFALGAFGGLETFLLNRLSLQIDIGPAYIRVSDSATSLSSGGLQFVINSGVNYYF